MSTASQREPLRVVVAGNPNVGKTSLFNRLTGSRYQVGNYPGVTVETRTGRVSSRWHGSRELVAVDLPGIYSLTALSEDESVAYQAIVGVRSPRPDVVLLVLDASNLARNLYLALQVLEQGIPVVIALNMVDVAARAGLPTDAQALSRCLGVPVLPTIARVGTGTEAVAQALARLGDPPPAPLYPPAPQGSALADALKRLEPVAEPARARWLLTTAAANSDASTPLDDAERRVLETMGPATYRQAAHELIAARYARVDAILAELGHRSEVLDVAPVMTATRRIDRLLTHPIAGWMVFLLVMGMVFNSIYTWAAPVMDAVEGIMSSVAGGVRDALGPGLFTDLLTDGVIAGAGNVVVFVPQIALLFLFLGLLEDSGYLARAAFLMDRLMARVGLHGRAFVPLLSGYACAIPAILATRTISSFRDRMVAMLMIPFMSCSARLPIYLLVTYALFDAERRIFGPFTEGSLIVLGMYVLSTVSALLMGWIYKRTILRGPTPPLVLELPPYRLPRLSNTLWLVYDRSMDFVRNAGTIILALTVVLWAVLSFPRQATDAGESGATAISQSYGGRAARGLEPALQPMGQDWRVGIGLIGAFAAREVLVSTLGLVYGMEADDDDQVSLRTAIRNDVDPRTGERRYTKLSGLALMVFFVYACQCMSTLAVVRRESRSWRWPLFMFVSMTAIAYVAAVAVYQVGRALGYA